MQYKFSNFNLENLKVCILGQDPYPQEGVATGLAFEASNIENCEQIGLNSSLRNILKLLHKNHTNSDGISNISEVRASINNGYFPILPPNQLFQHWESEGVLLLNTALTCTIEIPNSHKIIWSCLMKKILEYIDQQNPNCHWFLWGKNAKEFSTILTSQENKHFSQHPVRNTQEQESFFYANHFQLNTHIDWIGNNE